MNSEMMTFSAAIPVNGRSNMRVQSPKSNVQRPRTLDLGLWTLDFGPWTLDLYGKRGRIVRRSDMVILVLRLDNTPLLARLKYFNWQQLGQGSGVTPGCRARSIS